MKTIEMAAREKPFILLHLPLLVIKGGLEEIFPCCPKRNFQNY
jgi:hypothetical protein